MYSTTLPLASVSRSSSQRKTFAPCRVRNAPLRGRAELEAGAVLQVHLPAGADPAEPGEAALDASAIRSVRQGDQLLAVRADEGVLLVGFVHGAVTVVVLPFGPST